MKAPSASFDLEDITQFMDFKVFESALGSSGVISSTFWTLYFKNKDIPYKLHYYFLSIYISFLYFLSNSARNRANKNATGTGFDLKDVTQYLDFKVFEYAFGS